MLTTINSIVRTNITHFDTKEDAVAADNRLSSANVYKDKAIANSGLERAYKELEEFVHA